VLVLQLKRIGAAFDRIYRMEQNSNLEKIEQSSNSLQSQINNLVDGKFDDVALNTHIEEKLNDLETQYAPKLTEVSVQFTDTFLKSLQSGIKCIAHRGVETILPENTTVAFEKSGELGFWGNECDVQWTSDNVPVIYHDENINTLTNGIGLISALTYDQIKSYHLTRGVNVSRYGSSLRICSFEEYLKICKKYNMHCFIELKFYNTLTDQNIDSLVALIEKYNVEKQCVIMHINRDILLRVRSRNKNLTLMYMVEDNHSSENMQWMVKNAPCIAGCNFSHNHLTSEKVDEYHSLNIPVAVYTVTHLHDAQLWINKNVDIYISRILIDSEVG